MRETSVNLIKYAIEEYYNGTLTKDQAFKIVEVIVCLEEVSEEAKLWAKDAIGRIESERLHKN